MCFTTCSSSVVLASQVYQLQQEKKKLQEDFSQLLQEREQLEERCSSYEHEKIQIGPRLEETKWEVRVSSLRSRVDCERYGCSIHLDTYWLTRDLFGGIDFPAIVGPMAGTFATSS